ncbi:cholinesterase-like [Limulus polyphemus]|uniref:Cholinesterase-like n=1 Tax=Limulus polyphemus TaxID=6850 RepID=A0ABM1THX6_LIMPO|nr:cholinesterase-like [Limulus polyphemus]
MRVFCESISGACVLCVLVLLILPQATVSQHYTSYSARTPGPNVIYDFRNVYQSPGNNRQGSAVRKSDIFDYGDQRCPEAYSDELPVKVTVDLTRETVIEGRYVYLCDGPGVPERDRPQNGNFRPVTKFYKNITAFLGIPYAEPPVKERGLRFKDPRPSIKTGKIGALKYKPGCPQYKDYYGIDMGIENVDEDCLYLNVFSPYAGTQLQSQEKYPVMVYIHGGDWDHGSASTFPPHVLVASQEVIVVTFNYRLGPLGFLATTDNSSAGNYGMLDQAFAIQWVFDYISHFNGDQNKITLFGPGAGAASAGLHAISPRTREKVKRVIAQSGSAVADWAVILDPLHLINNTLILGDKLGCTSSSPSKLVECVQSRSVSDFSNSKLEPMVGRLAWGPVLDRETRQKEHWFLPDSPEFMLENGHVQFDADFSYMGGVTTGEAAAILSKNLIYKCKQQVVQLHEGYINLLSDSYFVAPNDKMLKLMLKNDVKTYMYVLNYTIEGLAELRPEWFGVPHDTEYFLSTGAPFMDPKFYPKNLKLSQAKWTESDREMSQFLLEVWGSFAKYGKPTQTSFNGIQLWKPMTLKNLQFLAVNTANFTSIMERDYRQKQSQFWNDYLPFITSKLLPTWAPTFQPYKEEFRIYSASLWGVVGAAGLFLMLTLLFCCLYCKARKVDSY